MRQTNDTRERCKYIRFRHCVACSGGKSWPSAAEASTRRRSPSRAGCSCGAAGKWVLARLEHIAQSRLTHRCCVSASAIGAVERLCSLPVWRGPRGRYFGQLGHGDTLDRKSPKQLRESGRTSRAAVWHTTPNHTTPHMRANTHERTNPGARVYVWSPLQRVDSTCCDRQPRTAFSVRCRAMPSDAVQCRAMPCRAMPCRAMPCQVRSVESSSRRSCAARTIRRVSRRTTKSTLGAAASMRRCISARSPARLS